MTQAALDAGHGPIDYKTVDKLYSELAIRKPSQWKATFNNARTKGYLTNVAPGIWKTTVPEGLARYGTVSKSGATRRPSLPRSSVDEEPG